ncbi:MAG: hypothetical protein AB7O97_24195 [Planctomycetota bacterium]
MRPILSLPGLLSSLLTLALIAPTTAQSDVGIPGPRPMRPYVPPRQAPLEAAQLPQLSDPLFPVPQLRLAYKTETFVAVVDALDDAPVAVLLSLSPELTHYLVDLPPLLSNPLILGVVPATGGQAEFVLPRPAQEVPVYGQALVFMERLLVSDIAVTGFAAEK